MKRISTIFLCALMIGCASTQVVTESSSTQSLAKFEILGMLDEYMGRTLTGDGVERFYPSEQRAASRFEGLLRQLCASEKIRPDWKRSSGRQGHIYFESAAIAAVLNRHYSPEPSYMIGEAVGYLRADALRSASHPELIRFVQGSYTRYGDEGRRPIFHGANFSQKFRLLVDVLRRLGCSEVCLYDDHTSRHIPTAYTLTFRPTAELIEVLGVSPQLSDADVKDLLADHRTKVTSLKPD